MSNTNRQLQGKIATCYGCGEELKNTTILVCAECLENECTEFEKLAQEEEELNDRDIID